MSARVQNTTKYLYPSWPGDEERPPDWPITIRLPLSVYIESLTLSNFIPVEQPAVDKVDTWSVSAVKEGAEQITQMVPTWTTLLTLLTQETSTSSLVQPPFLHPQNAIQSEGDSSSK